MDLTYEKDGHDTKVMGDATLTISVHVLFFSVTVSPRFIASSPGRTTIPRSRPDQHEHDWNDYLKAFAC